MRHDFLTDLFYESPVITLDVFNKLNNHEHIFNQDNYGSGTYLTLSINDNEKTREILSNVISDFDAYISFCSAKFDDVEEGEILLDALQSIHKEYFEEGEIGFDWESFEYECRFE